MKQKSWIQPKILKFRIISFGTNSVTVNFTSSIVSQKTHIDTRSADVEKIEQRR